MRQVRLLAVAETRWRTVADTRHQLAGSFAISEDSKPRVINLDFPPLPAGDGRYQKLLENGAEKIIGGLFYVEANDYQTPFLPPSLI